MAGKSHDNLSSHVHAQPVRQSRIHNMVSSNGDHSSYSIGMSAAEGQMIANLLTNALPAIDEGGRSTPNSLETS